ncbi:MAG: hypothetical protein ACQCN4_12120 [Candidatus Bathyarchaeia archaeon]|jgi:hypothetical protein
MRRLLKDNKGQVRVIEAFFAAVLLLSCLTLIPAQPTPKNTSGGNLVELAENTLVSLDSDGHISRLISDGDWAALGKCLESALPLAVWFNLTVYDQNRNILNSYPICNGGAVSNTVSSFSYVCASSSSNYAVYVLQLQLAAVD